ncbi:hypothetical protein Anas_00343 [Armadillidium nasatum]|uniref:LysM domain-containing protein n=1 Tax=Armadillidium nasatum TaxID=96803 RepID=A0A5N5TIN5_9CRUS|nr:hypothetical protein Anas_00343 [Armadillidium nasatum]
MTVLVILIFDKRNKEFSEILFSFAFQVQANDTLMSIAARFDTTPSELTKMNRLSTRFLFPGQILTVPDKGGAKENLGTDSSRASSDIVKGFLD